MYIYSFKFPFIKVSILESYIDTHMLHASFLKKYFKKLYNL